MDDVLKLIGQTMTKNKYGVDEPTPEAKEIFCEVHSVSRSEVFEGGRNGLNPAFQFTIFAEEYEGESIVEYNGETYSVYRTYRIPSSVYRTNQIPGTDYMELYVERKGGTNGQKGDSGDPGGGDPGNP
ncbi:MAG: hypothetical protein K6E91_11100 [Butyrivibrio sp.]|nr:hypothetical protein [Butyrivibrio sp.]